MKELRKIEDDKEEKIEIESSNISFEGNQGSMNSLSSSKFTFSGSNSNQK